MAFTVTHTPPDINSTVTVKFAGQLLLRPNGTSMCDIGINRLAQKHDFHLMLIVNKPGLPATLLRLTTGPLTGPGAVTITKSPPGAGFKVFTKDAGTFDRANAANSTLDYRWTVDLQELHPGVDFNEGARPLATLNDGVLYTSNLSREGLNPALVRPGERKDLIRLASDFSAAMDLPAGAVLLMAWNEFGKPKTFSLPRPASIDPVGTRYTVVLLNDPPAVDDTPHDELDFYYRVLQIGSDPVPAGQRWKLIFDIAPKSDEIPCLPISLNG